MCPPPESAKNTTVVINGCPIGYYCILRSSLTKAIKKQNPNAVVQENMTWPLTMNITKDGNSRVEGLSGLAYVIKMLFCITSVDTVATAILEADKEEVTA